jgi:hypothetical protein
VLHDGRALDVQRAAARGVAAQVDPFESKTLKPGNHFDGLKGILKQTLKPVSHLIGLKGVLK